MLVSLLSALDLLWHQRLLQALVAMCITKGIHQVNSWKSHRGYCCQALCARGLTGIIRLGQKIILQNICCAGLLFLWPLGMCFHEAVKRNACGIICRIQCEPWNFPISSMQWLILAQIRCFHQWPLWSKWFLYCNQWARLLAMTLAVSAEETLKITRCESWPLYWYCQKREGSHSAGPSPLVHRAWFSDVLWVGKT